MFPFRGSFRLFFGSFDVAAGLLKSFSGWFQDAGHRCPLPVVHSVSFEVAASYCFAFVRLGFRILTSLSGFASFFRVSTSLFSLPWVLRLPLMSPRGSGAYVPNSLCRVVVQSIIHPIGLYRLKSLHPVIFSFFQEPTILGFRVRVMVFHLFYQCESCMCVEIVIWKCEVFVERSPAGVFHVVSVGVHAKICWGFTLPNVLSSWA